MRQRIRKATCLAVLALACGCAANGAQDKSAAEAPRSQPDTRQAHAGTQSQEEHAQHHQGSQSGEQSVVQLASHPSGHGASAGHSSKKAPEGWFASPEAVLQELVAGLNDENEVKIARTAINEHMFKNIYYPNSEIYRPERPRELPFIWEMSRANLLKGARRLVKRYGGPAYELVAWEHGEIEQKKAYRVWDQIDFAIREVGAEETIWVRNIGSFMEYEGGFRFFGIRD